MPERHWRLAFGALGGGAGHVHGGRQAGAIHTCYSARAVGLVYLVSNRLGIDGIHKI